MSKVYPMTERLANRIVSMVEEELKRVPNDKVRGIAVENIEAIKSSNRRDFRF